MSAGPGQSADLPRVIARRKYARPPVIEAIVGIGVVLPRKFKIRDLERAVATDADGYPQRQVGSRFELQAQGAAGAKAQATMRQEPNGFRWVDAQGGRIVTMQSDRFSFSKTRPYSEWPDVRNEASRLWQRFTAITRPTSVNRIGLRYINRIDIPLPTARLEDYFLTRLDIAATLPSNVSSWTFEVGMPQQDLADTVVVLRQARVAPPHPGVASIIFDIDVTKGMQLAGGYDAIWDQFETLHSRANLYFEGSITDKVRELFE